MGIIRLVVACVVLASCCLICAEGAGAGTTTNPMVLAPPVIHEVFTVLPCNKENDLGIEGCQERHIINLDTVIDRAEKVLFTMLENKAAAYVPTSGSTDQVEVAQRLSAAESDWFSYRVAECNSESDVALGGTDSPLQAGLCDIKLDQQRLTQLKSFYESLRGHSKKVPAFPKS